MVYVISRSGKPLMPTERHGRVRILLKNKKAKVINNKPFTIQLLYDSKEYTQPVTLGIDSGYTYIGYSAVTEDKELVSGEVELLQGQSERLKERAMYRGQRRARLRYRKPRFNNRHIPKGWLAPSLQHKLDSYIRFIDYLKSILPITKTTIEVANFDIQKIKNPSIEGKEYQEGEQLDHYNLREYILHRDNHTCQLCSKKNVPLEVHHIGYYKGDRSNRPGNLAALCANNCHTPDNHKEGGLLWGWKPELKGFKEAIFMSTVRWRLVNSLGCNYTYGYITKSRRIAAGLDKTHYNDAFVIAGGTNQIRVEPIYFKQVRRNNRSLERFYDAKYIDIRTGKKVSGQELYSGRTVRNKNYNTENLHVYRGTKVSKGRRSIRRQRYFYQPNDIVTYENKKYQVAGVQNKGAYIKLKGLKKVPKTDSVKPYRFMKGFSVA